MKVKLLLISLLFSNVAFSQFKNKAELKKVSSEMLSIIKKHSIVSDSINWKDFDAEISKSVDSIQDVEKGGFIVYKIQKILAEYGDKHSKYVNKTLVSDYNSKKDSIFLPTSKLINRNIGYLKLPIHLSMNQNENFKYADTLRKQIEYLDENNKIKGWIVDLRNNSGGNMWPMIAGLNPLLEDGTVGFFVFKNGKTSWISKSNRLGLKNFYKIKNLNSKIALLIGPETGSSGEMTAVSLLGMKNSKSFGEKSAGYTTSVWQYKLSNGASLFLADSYIEDRNHIPYRGKISPDAEVGDLEIIEKATNWIDEN